MTEDYSQYNEGDTVAGGAFTVRYKIRVWGVDGEQRFDWLRQDGEDSDTFFDSVDEAIEDAKRYIGC